jgi:hypothetical protein
LDSSPVDNIPKTTLISSLIANQDENENNDNEYDLSLPNKRIENTSTRISSSSLNNNGSTAYYEKQPVYRKLSSISEKTEKTETDDSETDLSRLYYYKPKQRTMIPTIHLKQYPIPSPKNLPIIKARRKIVRDDDNDNDSGIYCSFLHSKNLVLFSLGVEHSSSEKSFDGHNIQKQHSDSIDSIIKSKQRNPKSSSPLVFSKVFQTSVSPMQTIDDEVKKPSYITEIITPKPILKRTNQQFSQNSHQKNLSSIYTKTSPLLRTIPKPNPRSSLKQLKQDESLL